MLVKLQISDTMYKYIQYVYPMYYKVYAVKPPNTGYVSIIKFMKLIEMWKINEIQLIEF